MRVQILYLGPRTFTANTCESRRSYKDLYSNKIVFLDLVKEIKKNEEELIKQDRIEIVKNAIKLGMNDDDISKLTGLDIEEISKIRIKN